MRRLRIGMAQVNTIVGDFDGNTQKIRQRFDIKRTAGRITGRQYCIKSWNVANIVGTSRLIRGVTPDLE